MTAREGSPSRFLDPAVLGRIGNLELLAKTVVEGFISGLHRSPFVGRSMDFAEYRPYVPGDDIRQIDWKLFSRSDRYYVKEFEGDTNTQVHLAVDCSRSMDFGTAPLSKLDYARTLAACLAYFSNRQRDRVGLALFDDRVVEYVPPLAKHLQRVLVTLSRQEVGASGDLVGSLTKLASTLRRRGFVILVSDFYETPERVLEAIRGFKVRGHDVIVFHVLDPAELRLPYGESTSLQDLESGETQVVAGDAFRRQYQQLIEGHIAALRKSLRDLDIDYTVLDTSEPLDKALYSYLSARAWSMKSR